MKVIWFFMYCTLVNCCVATCNTGFIETPKNLTLALRPDFEAKFFCEYCGNAVSWLLNGEHSIVFVGRGDGAEVEFTTMLVIKAHNGTTTYNNSKVECQVRDVNGTLLETATAFFLLQGTLAAVGDLTVTMNGNNSYSVRWNAPFSLSLTEPSNITYVLNVYVNFNQSVLYEHGISETRYDLPIHLNVSPCDIVTVTPINEAGSGDPQNTRVGGQESQCTGETSTRQELTIVVPTTVLEKDSTAIIGGILGSVVVLLFLLVVVGGVVVGLYKCKKKIKYIRQNQTLLPFQANSTANPNRFHDNQGSAIPTAITSVSGDDLDDVRDGEESELEVLPTGKLPARREDEITTVEDIQGSSPKQLVLSAGNSFIREISSELFQGEFTTIRRRSVGRLTSTCDQDQSSEQDRTKYTSAASENLPTPDTVKQEDKWYQTRVPSSSQRPREQPKPSHKRQEKYTFGDRPVKLYSDQSDVQLFSINAEKDTVIPAITNQLVLSLNARRSLVKGTTADQIDQPDTAAATTPGQNDQPDTAVSTTPGQNDQPDLII